MASQYPSINDTEFNLLKKITNNTALLDDMVASDVSSVNGRTGAVVLTKADIGDVASSTILGRSTAGSGSVEELSAAATRTLLGLADIATSGSGSDVITGTVADARIASALTGKTYNGLTVTSTTGTLTVAALKSLTVSNTLTLAGTDSSTLNVGSGGTLVSSAFTDTTNASNISSGTLADARIASALTGKSYNGITPTSNAIGFTMAGGTISKSFIVSNTLTLAGTDGSTLNVGAGGTLGTGAFQPQTVLTGTANQIAVSNSGVGATTVSIPTNPTLPGNVLVTGTLGVTGLVSRSVTTNGYDTGFHTTNLSTGAAASTDIQVANSASVGIMRMYGTGFSTSGFEVADSVVFYTNGAGGFNFQGAVKFWTAVTTAGTVTVSSTTEATTAGAGAISTLGGISFAKKMNVGTGVLPDSGGFKHSRVTTGSVSGASTALITVTWTTAFADANYTVQASVLDSTTTSLSLSVVHIESISASAVTVRVINNAATPLTGTLHIVAIHD